MPLTSRSTRATTARSRATSPRVRVLPYKAGSASAKLLSEQLSAPRLKVDGTSKFRSRLTDTVINWGSSDLPSNLLSAGTILNHPSVVALSSNKLAALSVLTDEGVPCLTFTTDPEQVRTWLREGHVVFARTLLNSHSGRGIIQLEGAEAAIPNAPLYTLYKKKQHEYRVHVLPDGSVSVRQKRKRNGIEVSDYRIRNHAGGYVFAHELSYLPEDLVSVAMQATRALDLDFAALDILYNHRDNQCYVIECNSAPGLDNSSARMYAEAFRRRIARGGPRFDR